mgnify:CR=1 FL=1|jgi:hypothetical protein
MILVLVSVHENGQHGGPAMLIIKPDETLEQAFVASGSVKSLGEIRAPSFFLEENAVPGDVKVGDLPLIDETVLIVKENPEKAAILEDFEHAMAVAPELMIPTSCYSVVCSINGISATALIDTGASTTTMSLAVARQLGLDKKIDARIKPEIQGVTGTQQAAGVIHLLQLEFTTMDKSSVGVVFSPTVLDSDGVSFILGIDVMRSNGFVLRMREGIVEIPAEGKPAPYTIKLFENME